MISANELRIGNYIEQGEIIELRSHVVRVKYRDRTSLVRYEELNHIPLDKYNIRMLGFIEDGTFQIIVNENYFELGLDGKDFMMSQYTLRINMEWVMKVKYVNQLQNIVYYLTGTELKIKGL